jgi:tRNA-splicing ligase RtcB
MPVKEVLTSGRVPVKIWTDEVDDKSRAQLSNIASLPFIHHHVAAMPDVHLGIGATIGSVIATHKAIIPAAVGVDLGCGMVAARLSLTANELYEKVRPDQPGCSGWS